MAIFVSSILSKKYINEVFNKFELETNKDSSLTLLTCISLGCCLSYSVVSLFNILAHLQGFTITSNFYLFFILVLLILYLQKTENIKRLFTNFISETKSAIPDFLERLSERNTYLSNLICLCIIICVFNLAYRIFLPISQEDQISWYFFDSLQISRLGNLKLEDFYNYEQAFRTDSLASFFDAYILQTTDSWLITRITKLISLIMSIGIACEVISIYKRISNFNYLLIVAVILSLADVWGMAVSGKHDIYILLLEIVAFRVSIFSFSCKSLNFKLKILTIPLLLSIVAVFSRLSSFAFLFVMLLFITYQIIISDKNTYRNNGYSFLFKNVIFTSIFISILGSIAFLNFKYLNNPFYIFSPPKFLSFLFPNANYIYSLGNFKTLFNIQGEYNIFYPIVLFSYTSLGLEQIRWFAYRLSHTIPYLESIYLPLSKIGPIRLTQSITAFSPFTILSLGTLNDRTKPNREKYIMTIFLILWFLIWSLSITYTRTVLALSILLTAYGISELQYPLKVKGIIKRNLIYKFKRIIFIYAIITLCSTSLWGVYNLRHLPNLFTTSIFSYDRKQLSAEFIYKINDNQGTEYLVPPSSFISSWDSIKDKSFKNSSYILIDAPKSYAYFMSHGVIFSDISQEGISRINRAKSIVYNVNEILTQ